MELVTVIVPAYNVEQYIERCIDSLLNQTYSNIEILVIDDGSTDNTGGLIDNLSAADKRIVGYHKSNGGLSDARNYGLDRMNGSYVTFIDSDDFVSNDYIEHLMSIIHNKNADIAIVQALVFSEEGNIKSKNDYDFAIVSCEEAVRRMLIRNGITHSACGKLYKSKLWEKIRFPYQRLFEDYLTIFDVFSKASYIAISNAKIYYYFQRAGSIMHTQCNKKTVSIVRATQEVTPRIIEYWPELELEALDLQMALCMKCYQSIINYNQKEFVETQKTIKDIRNKNLFKLIFTQKIPYKDKFKMLLSFCSPNLYVKIYNRFDGCD